MRSSNDSRPRPVSAVTSLPLFLLSWLLLPALLAPTPVQAATWEGITIDFDTDWPGCRDGGYFPVRVDIHNRGNPRTIRFVCRAEYGQMPTVSRTLQVDTTRMSFHLLIPVVAPHMNGRLSVFVDGSYVPELSRSLSLAASRSFDERGPAVLLVDTKDGDWTQFAAAVLTTITSAASSTHIGYTATTGGDDHQFVPPGELPLEWQAYTGLDIVILSEDRLQQLTPAVRSAILKWVDTGGTLLIYHVGDIDAEPTWEGRINRLLDAAPGSGWKREPSPQTWSTSRKLGRVYAIGPNPVSSGYTEPDWRSLLNSIGENRWEWSSRMGFSSRSQSPDFTEFLIPSVKGVPVIAFLVLITLFTVAIGPVNYMYLWKRRRLYLLVVTIPLIAFVTSLSLFGYSAIAHGFGARSRVRSLTLLDQRSNTLVQSSRVALYAGLAPSDGLTFTRDSAVFPVWPPDGQFESGTVDWTNAQHFETGWLRSRTRTQFVVQTHRNERGRLEIKPDGNALSVANGLEWDIRSLFVTDASGQVYYGTDLAAGDLKSLRIARAADATEFTQLVGEHPLQHPAGSSPPAYGYYGYYNPYGRQTAFSTSIVEDLLRHANHQRLLTLNEPNRFVAILAEPPGVDIGIDDVSEEASLHVLMGWY